MRYAMLNKLQRQRWIETGALEQKVKFCNQPHRSAKEAEAAEIVQQPIDDGYAYDIIEQHKGLYPEAPPRSVFSEVRQISRVR